MNERDFIAIKSLQKSKWVILLIKFRCIRPPSRWQPWTKIIYFSRSACAEFTLISWFHHFRPVSKKSILFAVVSPIEPNFCHVRKIIEVEASYKNEKVFYYFSPLYLEGEEIKRWAEKINIFNGKIINELKRYL